jgi:hypothetical protein
MTLYCDVFSELLVKVIANVMVAPGFILGLLRCAGEKFVQVVVLR